MYDLQNIIKDTKIRLCLDCGKCTVVCPVNRYDTDFNPRLIVQRALGKDRDGDKSIWSCINCNMCTERCNYNVKYTDFIRALRYQAIQDGTEVEYNHGCTCQTYMHIMGRKDIKQDRLDWLPADIKLDKKSNTAFVVGCTPYFDVIFNDLEVNTLKGTIGALRLMNRAEVPFTLLENERCCGRDLLLMGDVDGFLNLAKANQDEFRKRGIKNIITACPEGYYTLKVDYPQFLDDWDVNVKHVIEVIAPLIDDGKLSLGRINKKITYHDPCTLGRYSRIFEEPRKILRSVAGVEIIEMKDNREKSLCCGASPWAFCDSVNKQIQKERLSQAVDTGAEMLVTACPKCKIHLTCAQKTAEADEVPQIEIRDLFELIDQALAAEEE
jgi:heterodisulfide reductase subunit D